MKKLLSILLVLLLLLTGCQAVQKTPADDGMQHTTNNKITDLPANDLPKPEIVLGAIGSYTMAPEHLYLFVYDGSPPSYWRDIDTSACVIGSLYIEDKNTGVVTKLADGGLMCNIGCKEFVLYVTEREPQKVWRTDYTGSSHTVVYEASYGDITQVECYDNVGEKGQLAILEGSTHIVLYDFATTQSQVLVTQQDIDHFNLSLYGRKGYVGFRKKDWSRWSYDTATGELMEDTSL